MKRRLLTCLGLPLVLSCLTGCSDSGYPDLSLFKLDDVGNYSAIGYGAVGNGKSESKKARRNASAGSSSSSRARGFLEKESTIVSDSPFTLMGQMKSGGVSRLSFSKDGDSGREVYINGFWDLGSLVRFDVTEAPSSDEEGKLYSLNVEDVYALLNARSYSYILSKKTGKVYQCPDDGYYPVKTTDEAFYCSIGDAGLCKLYEENETLRLEEIVGPSVYVYGVDEYGNALTSLALRTAKGEVKMLSSCLSGSAKITYSNLLGKIIAEDEGKTYVLDSQGEFVERFAGEAYVNEGYDIFDSEKSSALPSFPGVEGSEAKTWQEYLGEGEAEFGPVTIDNPRSWYCYAIPWLMENKESLEDYDELLQSKFASITEEELLKACVSCIGNRSLFFDEKGYLLSPSPSGPFYFGSTTYNPLESYSFGDSLFYFASAADSQNGGYGYGFYKENVSDACYYVTGYLSMGEAEGMEKKSVVRGSNMYYYYPLSSEIRKVSLLSFEQTEVKTDGYMVTSLDVDEEGNIVISGVDASLASFTGYLDANDEVSFTKEEGISYTFYPIN